MITLQRLNVVRIVETEGEAEQLISRGFEHIEESEEAEKLIGDMTSPELKAYAKKKGIDLGDATKKEDILIKIQEAEGGE
ncbi:hypothetical protein J2T12_005103 [Paenibacillus anaericanus]|uniref:hypothetical protein n=1 Tax=Paenibacillus anaericanus TaxID=170367 RepID=UPI00277FE993|nr:hypothetical protein [Paenibacillus anaericanus]MDQ0091663.1 hypothetical protein [Paenibacillus anaericanus]